ncbi:hypothetical protein POX_e06802 [Penicillium oxalicum]|nr:hypothetical protein POX_e06802 [Penicillium oxalicum]KAI2788781.1 hypothetical protein POX_e06802 [Penicillium oxalicum]
MFTTLRRSALMVVHSTFPRDPLRSTTGREPSIDKDVNRPNQ